jgi:hypothetical protein
MHSSIQQKEKKIVPRFRRKNVNKNLIDADDEEAQALIEKDLQSHFKWTSDTIEDYKYQFDQYQDNQQQQISIVDLENDQFIYDIDNNNQQLWYIHIQDNEKNSLQWTDDQQQEIHLNIESIQHQQQKWTLNDNNQQSIQFHLNEQLDNKYHLDTINQNKKQKFIKGEQFRHQVNLLFNNNKNNSYYYLD